MSKKDIIYICAIIGVIVFTVVRTRDNEKIISSDRALQVDTLPLVTTYDTSQYIPIFGNSPKAAKGIKLKFISPFSWTTGNIKPRNTNDNMTLGTTSSYPYKLYVNGHQKITQNLYMLATKKIYLGNNVWIGTSDDNTMTLYDATNGSQTLATLLSGGVSGNDFDTINISAGASNWNILGVTSNLYFDYNNSGSSRLTVRTDGATKGKVLSSYGNFSSNANPTTVVAGDLYYNTVAGKYITYNGSSWDTLGASSGTGSGVVDTTGLPQANQFTYFTAANKIASSSNLTRATNGVISYTGVGFVFNDSAYIDYEADGFMEWVGKSKTGALFSDSLAPAGYGLTMPLPRIADALRAKDGEIKWWLSDSAYTYRPDTLAPAEMVRALVASAEQDKRYILELYIMTTVLILIMAVACGFIIAVTIKMLRK